MSYKSIALMAQDQDLRARIRAAIAMEGNSTANWQLEETYWKMAAASDWDDAYDYAQATNVERPGWNESVITDQMILSRLQALYPPYVAPGMP